MVGAADSALIREVSFIGKFHCTNVEWIDTLTLSKLDTIVAPFPPCLLPFPSFFYFLSPPVRLTCRLLWVMLLVEIVACCLAGQRKEGACVRRVGSWGRFPLCWEEVIGRGGEGKGEGEEGRGEGEEGSDGRERSGGEGREEERRSGGDSGRGKREKSKRRGEGGRGKSKRGEGGEGGRMGRGRRGE